jgi:hypothetical protein
VIRLQLVDLALEDAGPEVLAEELDDFEVVLKPRSVLCVPGVRV